MPPETLLSPTDPEPLTPPSNEVAPIVPLPFGLEVVPLSAYGNDGAGLPPRGVALDWFQVESEPVDTIQAASNSETEKCIKESVDNSCYNDTCDQYTCFQYGTCMGRECPRE
jgi:hypothetical protein